MSIIKNKYTDKVMHILKNNININININNTQIYLAFLFIVVITVTVIVFIKYKVWDKLIVNQKDLFTSETEYILPRIVWVYWDKEELPKDISLMYNNNKNILTNWEINLLNSNNLKNYLDINEFPKNYDKFSAAHKADLIRLKLLKKYGGVWMDAATIINNKDVLEKLFKDTLDNKIELTAMTLDDQDKSYTYHQYIENWFMIAPKNSHIISLWLEEFEKAYSMGFKEYGNYVKDDLKVKICERLINSGVYHTQHRALQTVLQYKINMPENKYTPKLLLLNSEDYMFKLMHSCKWKIDCIKDKIENDNNTKNIPSIKFIGGFRDKINFEKYYASINNTTDNYILPRIIWIYWDKEELPKDISLIYNNNKDKLTNWDIKLLNNSNLKNYLDINELPKNYDTFQPAHKSDLIRLKLLKKYGGVWMDAAIIINNKDELEKVFKDTLDNKIELTAMTLGEKENDKEYIYHQNIENWFIIAPKNSYIVSLWLEEFEKAYSMGFDDYKRYIKDDLHVKLCHNIDKFGTYLTEHMALQVVLQNRIKKTDTTTNTTTTSTTTPTTNPTTNPTTHPYTPKLLLLKSEDNMLKFSTECNWDSNCVKNKLQNTEEAKKIPYIKLTRFEREYGLELDKYFN